MLSRHYIDHKVRLSYIEVVRTYHIILTFVSASFIRLKPHFTQQCLKGKKTTLIKPLTQNNNTTNVNENQVKIKKKQTKTTKHMLILFSSSLNLVVKRFGHEPLSILARLVSSQFWPDLSVLNPGQTCQFSILARLVSSQSWPDLSVLNPGQTCTPAFVESVLKDGARSVLGST